jgi:hypothetical protein
VLDATALATQATRAEVLDATALAIQATRAVVPAEKRRSGAGNVPAFFWSGYGPLIARPLA